MKAKTDSRVASRVAIISAGDCQVHVASMNSVYATLCGLDGYDLGPTVQQSTCSVGRREQITCPECFVIWLTAKEYKKADFHPSLKNIRRAS